MRNIPVQKRKIIGEIFVVITIIFTTLVKKFELMKHLKKTQLTFSQIQSNISPSKIPFGTVYCKLFVFAIFLYLQCTRTVYILYGTIFQIVRLMIPVILLLDLHTSIFAPS